MNGVNFKELAVDLRKQLDAQRLRVDTAEAERDAWKDMREQSRARNAKLRKKLSAAEQRIAELVELLSKAKLAVDDVAENCEDQTDWASAKSMHALSERIDAALNPKPEAESHDRIPD